jgi:hypothetical protein
MKKLICLFPGIIAFMSLGAQLSLTHSFNFSANITKINESEYKYYLMDVSTSQCRIYNPDFSLYKAITLAVPGGEWLYDIRFVSENLFNSDSKLEMLYTFYKWVITDQNTGDGYYEYHSMVVNEEGTILLDAPGALYSYVKETGIGEYSLFLYVYDFSLNPESIKTNIYRLPGTVNEIYDLQKKNYTLHCYPNPNPDVLTIDFSLPEDMTGADLHIIDGTGHSIDKYRVNGNSGKFQLRTVTYMPGLYYYFLEHEGRRSEVKKIVIQ